MVLKTKDIEDIFDSVYNLQQIGNEENRIFFEKREHKTGVIYTHNYELEKRIQTAIRLRRKLAEIYTPETHKVIFEVLDGKISQRKGNRGYFLGILLFLDYLQTEGLYFVFRDVDKYNAFETKTRNKLFFKIIQYADTQLAKGNIKPTESFTTLLNLLYCYKYLYCYQREDRAINFFDRNDANPGRQYCFNDISDLVSQLLRNICYVKREKAYYDTQIIVDCFMQIEINRKMDNLEEEHQVSFRGMSMLFLMNDQAIKFISLSFLYPFFKSVMGDKAINKMKFVQRYFFMTAKNFGNTDQKFLWLYLQKLLDEKEYDLYGHLMRICPEIYGVLKQYFKERNKDYVSMLLKETEQEFGNLIYVLFECEFHKDIFKFESFITDHGIVAKHNWYAWFIVLQKYVVQFKKTIHKDELETLRHMLSEDLRKVGGQYPMSEFSNGEKNLLAETILNLMVQYAGKEGKLHVLLQDLGENNLLKITFGNWDLLKYIKNHKSSLNIDEKVIITYLAGLTKEEAWDVYMNSALRFILSIQELMNIMGEEWAEASAKKVWRFYVKQLNPEEKTENRIELYSYDFFVDENYILRPEAEWAERNYPYLCNVNFASKRYETVEGYPIRDEDGVVYIRVLSELALKKPKKDPDYKKVFRWLEEIQRNDYVYNPFLLYSKEGTISTIYLTDKKEVDFEREDKAIFFLPKLQEEQLKNQFAVALFDTMLLFKRKKLLLKKFLSYVTKTSIAYVNEYYYEFGRSTETIEKSQELASRAADDLERLCSDVQAGSYDSMQNIVNIYANTYLKYYVDLSSFLRCLSKSFSEKVMMKLGYVQAYGYEDRMYSNLYFHFRLYPQDTAEGWKPCLFTQEDIFCEKPPMCKVRSWNYADDRDDNNRYVFRMERNKKKAYFRQRKNDEIYLTLDMYQNGIVYLKSMRTNYKVDSAEELQRLFTQLGKEGITQKQEKALMKAIKDALIKMKKLDLVKQRFLAIHIERVLKQRNYESKKYLDLKKMLKDVETETHEKVFDLRKPHFDKEEAALIREEFAECTKFFVDKSIDIINAGRYAKGLDSIVEIYNTLIYGQCLSKEEVIRRLDGKLIGYSREDIYDSFSR